MSQVVPLRIDLRAYNAWSKAPHTASWPRAVPPAVRDRVLRDARGQCQSCRLLTQDNKSDQTGHLEIHHRDHDHRNLRPTNLVAICPLCHDVFHLGFKTAEYAGALGLTPISQASINHLATVVGVSRFLDEGHPVSETARALWTDVVRDANERRIEVMPHWSDGNPTLFLEYAKSLAPQVREEAAPLIPDLKFLPNLNSNANVYYFKSLAEGRFSALPIESWASLAKKIYRQILSQQSKA